LIIINQNAKHDGHAKQEFSETSGWHVQLIGDNNSLWLWQWRRVRDREEHEATAIAALG